MGKIFLSLSRHNENQLGKQTNKSSFLYVQKRRDNCYLIPVENKNSIFISE